MPFSDQSFDMSVTAASGESASKAPAKEMITQKRRKCLTIISNLFVRFVPAALTGCTNGSLAGVKLEKAHLSLLAPGAAVPRSFRELLSKQGNDGSLLRLQLVQMPGDLRVGFCTQSPS